MPSFAKVKILWNLSVKIHRYIFSSAVVKNVPSCGVYCVPCSARHTIHTDGPKHIGANIRYFNCTF